jgi:hypothetical protein
VVLLISLFSEEVPKGAGAHRYFVMGIASIVTVTSVKRNIIGDIVGNS